MSAETRTVIGFLGGILTLAAFGPYIISTIKRETKPERATWWIWTLNSVLLLASYRAEGAQETIWLSVAYTIGCITIALFSIKYGTSTWSKLDLSCLIGTSFAGILWVIIGPLATFIASLIIDLFGITPTIYRSFHHPEEENVLSWFMWFTGGFLSILVVENILMRGKWSWDTLTIAAYPLQITITDTIVLLFLIRPRFKNYLFPKNND